MIRVLIVEDEPPIQRSLKNLIEKLHPEFMVVDTALDGEEAITKLQMSTFDVVFTDIMMPIIDGFGVLSYIYENNLDMICVILSGYEEFEYARKAIHYHVQDYLLKPISIDQLTELLYRISQLITEKRHALFSTNLPDHPFETDEELSLGSTSNIIAKMEDYLKSNLTANITHQSLAEQYGFSPSYLSKLFKKYCGASPSEYLTNLRIEKAKFIMKKDPEILTKAIAPMVGFSDPFYFSKIIKKHTGWTPKEYKTHLRR